MSSPAPKVKSEQFSLPEHPLLKGGTFTKGRLHSIIYALYRANYTGSDGQHFRLASTPHVSKNNTGIVEKIKRYHQELVARVPDYIAQWIAMEQDTFGDPAVILDDLSEIVDFDLTEVVKKEEEPANEEPIQEEPQKEEPVEEEQSL
jgi:hypothetical protein